MAEPIAVIQAFRRDVVLDKEGQRAHDRTSRLAWPTSLLSTTGEIRDGELLVPATALPDAERATDGGLIVLDDVVGDGAGERESGRAAESRVLAFPCGATVTWDVFRLARAGEEIAVWLDYTTNAMTLGAPPRPDMKLAELAAGESVHVSLNGKRDFSMTGRRARTYVHFECVLVHLGFVPAVRAMPSAVASLKQTDRESARHVDLTKVLY